MDNSDEIQELETLDPPTRVERAHAKAQAIAQNVGTREASQQEYQQLTRELDPVVDAYLRSTFYDGHDDIAINRRNAQTERTVSAKTQIITEHLSQGSIPDHIDTPSELSDAITSGELDRRSVQKVIDARPDLEGFTLDHAIALAKGDEEAQSVREQFPDANPDIMMAVAYTLLDNNMEAVGQRDPRFYLDHRGESFAEMAAVNIFYGQQDNEAYSAWEASKRSEVIERISASHEIMSALNDIRSGNHVNSIEEVEEQYVARSTVAKGIADIYADVYGLDTFDSDDVSVAHKSLKNFRAENVNGVAWSTEVGVEGDEAVVLFHNPYQHLMVGSNPEDTNEEARASFLYTTVEEMQHTADKIYGDKLVNGDISAEHPAYDHSTLITLNSLNFMSPGRDREGYEEQFIERTAKEVADDVSSQVVRALETTGIPEPQEQTAQDAVTATDTTIQLDNPKL